MKIITISREYGAGGHSIGRKVAEELGLEFYDKDIIKETAKKLGISPEELAENEEKISTTESILRTISPISYDMKDAYFNAEKETILSIVKNGPCVILGRCADTILEEEGIETLNVFLYGDELHREKRVGEILGTASRAEIKKAIKATDTARHKYYYNYTGKNWKDLKNYNLVIDTGVIGFDTAVKIIVEAAKSE